MRGVAAGLCSFWVKSAVLTAEVVAWSVWSGNRDRRGRPRCPHMRAASRASSTSTLSVPLPQTHLIEVRWQTARLAPT
jgi:hypothetical protein